LVAVVVPAKECADTLDAIMRRTIGSFLKLAVALHGEFDLETAPELDRRLAGIEPSAGAPGRLLIDLRAVRFLDSSGLAAIIRAKQWAEARRCELVLRRGPRQAQRLFQVAGVDLG
jgi:anti-sigma B factor antagonist